TTTVVPTGTNEDVVVEARFNGDEIQPRFVLPVVTPRTIPIKVFIVDPPLEYCHNAAPGIEAETPWSESSIHEMIHTANEVFSQVAIMFNLIGVVTIIDEPNAWRIPYGRYVRGLDGKWTWECSDKMLWFVLSHRDPDCIRIYFVGEIVSDEKVKAMATP
ncbi:MAG: hypothetical protein IKL96_07805, partial [Kiritimatiellae bacterium]|nr:hypothetical protein [Kiritimatiellia bacterium]